MTTTNEYKAGDKVPAEIAKTMNWWHFGTDKPFGTKELKCVAVCKSNRIVCDPVDYYVMLECKVMNCNGEARWAVITPRLPHGLHSGVSVGVPMIAARDMQPSPHRTFVRSFTMAKR